MLTEPVVLLLLAAVIIAVIRMAWSAKTPRQGNKKAKTWRDCATAASTGVSPFAMATVPPRSVCAAAGSGCPRRRHCPSLAAVHCAAPVATPACVSGVKKNGAAARTGVSSSVWAARNRNVGSSVTAVVPFTASVAVAYNQRQLVSLFLKGYS